MSKVFKGYRPGRPHGSQRRLAYHEAARAYRTRHIHLPGAGYVVFYQGKACGWTEGIEGNPHGWLADCVAVPAFASEPLHIGTGGNYQDGAELGGAPAMNPFLSLVASFQAWRDHRRLRRAWREFNARSLATLTRSTPGPAADPGTGI